MMLKIVKLVLLLVLFCVSSSAADEVLDEVLLKMAAVDKKIENVSFKFFQEITYTLTNEKQIVSGEVVFKKPSFIIFKQDKPVSQEFVTNGKKVWVYTPSYNQVAVDSWKKWIKNGLVPASLLSFASDWTVLKKNFTLSHRGLKDSYHIISLKPVANNDYNMPETWEIEMSVGADDFIPKSMVLKTDTIVVKMRTSGYKINPEVDVKSFTYKVPKGVDVINMP